MGRINCIVGPSVRLHQKHDAGLRDMYHLAMRLYRQPAGLPRAGLDTTQYCVSTDTTMVSVTDATSLLTPRAGIASSSRY